MTNKGVVNPRVVPNIGVDTITNQLPKASSNAPGKVVDVTRGLREIH